MGHRAEYVKWSCLRQTRPGRIALFGLYEIQFLKILKSGPWDQDFPEPPPVDDVFTPQTEIIGKGSINEGINKKQDYKP